MDKYITIMVFLLCCYGCHKEDVCLSEISIGVDVAVCNVDTEDDGNIDEVETRTSFPANGSTASFISGDNIGVYETLTNRSNVSYTSNGTAWSTAATMYWRDGTSTHTFYAYYPYNAASTSTVAAIPILNNQTVTTIPDVTCDMLVVGPKTQKRTTGTSVPLTFTHAFSLLQFNVKLGSLLNLYVLNNITIQGGNTSGGANPYGMVNTVNSVSQIGYNLTSQSIQATTNTSAVYAQSLSRSLSSFSLLTSTTPFYFLVIPGTYTNPVPGVKFTVALLGLISTSKNFVNLSPPGNTFAPNTKYTYNVTVGGIIDNAPEPIQVTLVSQEPISSNDIFIN